MKITVLVDNIEGYGCSPEWGLSFYIEYNGSKILLDTGGSNKFFDNAKKLNINLNDVDYGVLSHAHYDHGNGLSTFFENNKTTKFYIQKSCEENCYKRVLFFNKYIGLQKGLLEKYKDRFILVDNICDIEDGVKIINHSSEGLDKIGQRENMHLKQNGFWIYDDFRHEQSLVFETKEGLIVFNSCSHGGVLNIIDEVRKEYPNKKILAYFGGLHLFNKKEDEVVKVAETFESLGIEHIYTGHCTGNKAYEILNNRLGGKIKQFKCGEVYSFE